MTTATTLPNRAYSQTLMFPHLSLWRSPVCRGYYLFIPSCWLYACLAYLHENLFLGAGDFRLWIFGGRCLSAIGFIAIVICVRTGCRGSTPYPPDALISPSTASKAKPATKYPACKIFRFWAEDYKPKIPAIQSKSV
jgi:hypothetical protein